MGIWSMQTCTAMQFPISMLGREDNLGAAKHQVSGSPWGEKIPNYGAHPSSDTMFWVTNSP